MLPSQKLKTKSQKKTPGVIETGRDMYIPNIKDPIHHHACLYTGPLGIKSNHPYSKTPS
jgi:hypothetical protein